jgi:hypothetical protein
MMNAECRMLNAECRMLMAEWGSAIQHDLTAREMTDDKGIVERCIQNVNQSERRSWIVHGIG